MTTKDLEDANNLVSELKRKEELLHELELGRAFPCIYNDHGDHFEIRHSIKGCIDGIIKQSLISEIEILKLKLKLI